MIAAVSAISQGETRPERAFDAIAVAEARRLFTLALCGFESFDAPSRRPHRRTLNLVAGVAGVAIVVAGVSVFAGELASRHGAKPPASATQSGLPSDSQLTLGLPSISHTVIQVTHGHGSASLPTFSAQGIIFIKSACIGTGTFGVQTPDHAIDMVAEGCYGGNDSGHFVKAACANGAIGTQEATKPDFAGGSNLTVEVAPKTYWEVQVYELPGAKS